MRGELERADEDVVAQRGVGLEVDADGVQIVDVDESHGGVPHCHLSQAKRQVRKKGDGKGGVKKQHNRTQHNIL